MTRAIEYNLSLEVETLKNNIIADYENWQNAGGKPRTEVQASMLDKFIQTLRVEVGNKYIKVITGSSVWGFIVNVDNDKKFRRGDLLLAAGWKTPARNKPRGNILDGGYTIRWTGPLYL